jgi:hypothetical protein
MTRIRKRLTRHKLTLLLSLSAGIAILALFISIREGFWAPSNLSRSKDLLAAINSLVGVVALAVALSLAYFRFFAGRTLAKSANVKVQAESAARPDKAGLHAITISVENIGSQSIHDLDHSLVAIDYLDDGTSERTKVTEFVENTEFDSEDLASLIDPGETVHVHAVRLVPPAVWASTYAAAIRDSRGNVWRGYALAASAAASNPAAKRKRRNEAAG